MKNILIVEDEFLIQKTLQLLLEKRGAKVWATSKGKEAIELIKSQHFDRIVCDLMLQDVTGFDILEESKQRYSLDYIRKLFVIITAYSSELLINKASTYGCTILSKPFSNLGRIIDLILDDRSINEQSEHQ